MASSVSYVAMVADSQAPCNRKRYSKAAMLPRIFHARALSAPDSKPIQTP
jgi:hypothetical protein